MDFRKHIGCVAVILMLATTSFAADLAVLRNGFSIPHERREQMGNVTRLYLSVDGANYTDVPTEQIDRFEKGPPTLPAPKIQAAPASMAIPAPASLDQAIAAGSERYRIDPDLISSVIRAESNFNARAVSPKGAQGLMQLMPKTADELGVKDSFEPEENIAGGSAYLDSLLKRYHDNVALALAAYNAGPGAVDRYHAVPPYRETRAYVARVIREFNRRKQTARAVAKMVATSHEADHDSRLAQAQ